MSPGAASLDAAGELAERLERIVPGGVDGSTRCRAEYSSDASNYRVFLRVVVFPRHVDQVIGVAEATRELGVPLTARGGGTSIAGNAIGPGVVVDFSRHLNRIRHLDVEARTAEVEPGVVLADLYHADVALLEAAGAAVTTVAGCCGLAGNFGMEKGHYEVSVAVAEHGLLPALRAAPADAVFLADGFSCRTQAVQLAGRQGVHLA